MLEDFIVPCLAAVVFPGWLLIMDNAPSHKAKKALEWYQTMLHEAGWALFSCQDTRHTQATVKATRAPPKCTLCTTPQALVVSFAAYSPDLDPLDTCAWHAVRREMVAVRGRVTLKAEAARAWTAARSCQQPGRLLHDWDERLALRIAANGGAFEHIYFIRLARFVKAIDTNVLSQCTQTNMTDHIPSTTARTR